MYTGLIYVHQCLLTCWGLFCPASRKSGRNHRDRRRKSKGNTHYKTACCLYFSVFCHGGFVHFSCHSCHFVEKVKACNVWHRDKTTRVWHRDKRTQKRRWPSIMVVQIPSRRPTSNLFRILSHTWSICCLTHGAYVVSHMVRMLSHTYCVRAHECELSVRVCVSVRDLYLRHLHRARDRRRQKRKRKEKVLCRVSWSPM